MGLGEVILAILIGAASGTLVFFVEKWWEKLFSKESYLERRARAEDEVTKNVNSFFEKKRREEKKQNEALILSLPELLKTTEASKRALELTLKKRQSK